MSEEQRSKKELRAQKQAEKAEKRAQEEKKVRQESFVQNIIIWSLVLLLGGGLVLFVANMAKTPSLPEQEQGDAVVQNIEIMEDDHIRGNVDAPITIVEYADFQCPHCRTASFLVDEVLDIFGDQVRVVYRHFNLSSFKNSIPASRAAEAAALQGKFFEMHDALFEGQQTWSSINNPKNVFRRYAEDIGLDIEAFETAYDSDEGAERASISTASGNMLGVRATPTFFVNGKAGGAGDLVRLVTEEIQALENPQEDLTSTDEEPETL